jgi:hypothetical protein
MLLQLDSEGGIMDHAASPLGDFFPGPGPVPAVDATDLRAAWDLQNDLQARHPGQSISISASSYQRVLRPGADAGAAWYRLSVFRVLQQMSKAGALPLPWLSD